MASCKLCDRSGWFLSLSTNALCGNCEPYFQLDLHQRIRVIHDSQEIVSASKHLETKLFRIQFAIDHLTALQNYERRGINTINPPPSQAIRHYELRRKEEISDHAALAHDDAVAKSQLAVGSRTKLTALSKGLLKLRELRQCSADPPDNIRPLEQDLVQRMATATITDYLDKARKAEFKGKKEKALEQYYEALYFLKHDDVEDHLQAEHIALLEHKIVTLGGTLNYQQSQPVSL